MAFHDLNVAWSPSSNAQLPRTLAFLSELGYNVVALNHSMTGKLPADLVNLPSNRSFETQLTPPRPAQSPQPSTPLPPPPSKSSAAAPLL